MALLDSITNAPKPQKLIFGFMVLVIVGALGFFLVISPTRLERDDLFQKNEDARLRLTKAQADEARLRREGFLHPRPIVDKWRQHLSGALNWQYLLWDALMFQAWHEHHHGTPRPVSG